MRKIIITLYSIAAAHFGIGQSLPSEYGDFVRKADSSFNKGNYKTSSFYYTSAFKSNGWKAELQHRWDAARSWALSGNADSALFQLELLATKSNDPAYFTTTDKTGMSNYSEMSLDKDWNSLRSDKRWAILLNRVKQNKEMQDASLNKPLANQLDNIYIEDQKYRLMSEDIEKKYGFQSKEKQDIWKIINKADSINLIKVTTILNHYGWLGPDAVGNAGAITLWLVIQHADPKTQERYLPMLREAVKNGKALAANLALTEDRVAIAQGKKQIYGSQIHQDQKTGKYFVAPIEDEPNVNKRRAAVGLGPLEDYVRRWDIDYKLPIK